MQQIVMVFFGLMFLIQTPSLDSLSPKERREAIQSMAILGNVEAVSDLIAAYRKEPRKDLRASIAAALGEIRDRSAIPGLSEILLGDFDREVRLQAVYSLLRLYIPIDDDDGGFWSFIARVRNLFNEKDRPIVAANTYVDQTAKEILVQSLERDFDIGVRIEAANALGSLRAVDQLPGLIEQLEGPRNREARDVRIAIIQAMGMIGSQDAGPALTRMLKDEDDRIVEEAIQVLGVTSYKAAYPDLLNLFKTSRNGDIREYSLQAIALMREPDAISLLESLFDHSDDAYRRLSAEGLGRLDYDATLFADRIETEKSDSVRLAMFFALIASGESDHIEQLVLELDSQNDYQAETYLIELGRHNQGLANMYPYLTSPKSEIRAKLVRVLGKIGDPAARPYILPLTEDPNMDVMKEAVDALRNLNPSGL